MAQSSTTIRHKIAYKEGEALELAVRILVHAHGGQGYRRCTTVDSHARREDGLVRSAHTCASAEFAIGVATPKLKEPSFCNESWYSGQVSRFITTWHAWGECSCCSMSNRINTTISQGPRCGQPVHRHGGHRTAGSMRWAREQLCAASAQQI